MKVTWYDIVGLTILLTLAILTVALAAVGLGRVRKDEQWDIAVLVTGMLIGGAIGIIIGYVGFMWLGG